MKNEVLNGRNSTPMKTSNKRVCMVPTFKIGLDSGFFRLSFFLNPFQSKFFDPLCNDLSEKRHCFTYGFSVHPQIDENPFS